jgi:hypothetical protein
MKTCHKCGVPKDESEFSPDKRSPDGLVCRCYACRKPDDAAYRAAHPTANREYRTAHRVRIAAIKKAYRESHPYFLGEFCRLLRRIAKHRHTWAKTQIGRCFCDVVRLAKKLGLLVPPAVCPECGRPHPLHFHHDEYIHPCVGRWLCAECHTRWHKANEPFYPDMTQRPIPAKLI